MSTKPTLWPYSPLSTVFLLAPIVLAFALALDVYLPAVPEMRQIFNTTPSRIQLTLSLFFFVAGFGQLIVGPLSDQFGRYKILLASTALFVLGSLLCANAEHINWLITFRIIQGFGACGMFVCAFAIVRDVFSDKQSAMIYSFLNATISISPILGPLLGVILISYFPWYAVFYFLTGFSLFTLLLVAFFVKESCPPEQRKKFNLKLFNRYFSICKSLTFWAYTCPAITGLSAFFTLFSMTPYVVKFLSQPLSKVSLFFGMAGATYLVGSLICGAIVQQLGTFKTTFVGTLLVLISGFVLIVVYNSSGLSLWGFFGPSLLAIFGCALAGGAGAGGAMAPFGEFPGAASAVFGSMQFGVSSIAGSIATLFNLHTSYPLAIVMLITASISLGLLVSVYFRSIQSST